MNLHAQLDQWLHRPVRVAFAEAPPREGRLAAVHADYLTLLDGDQLLHCPLRHIASLRRPLSAGARAVSAELESELAALPQTFAAWLDGAAGAWVEFNNGEPGHKSGRLDGHDGFGFTLKDEEKKKDEEGGSGYYAVAHVRWISRRDKNRQP